jgi:SAM-dependent methyltransferase
MWYPSEALVRIVRHHERAEGFSGVILDHGCGSGPGAEFLVRSGHNVVCSDVSEHALGAVRSRFIEARLPLPPLVIFDPLRPLGKQLPRFDHVIAWMSLYYNTMNDFRRHVRELIGCLPQKGVFIASFPTMNDVVVRESDLLADGTRRLVRNLSGQGGALLAIPSTTELTALCGEIEIRDIATYGMTFGGKTNEYFVLYGVKR